MTLEEQIREVLRLQNEPIHPEDIRQLCIDRYPRELRRSIRSFKNCMTKMKDVRAVHCGGNVWKRERIKQPSEHLYSSVLKCISLATKINYQITEIWKSQQSKARDSCESDTSKRPKS